MDKEIIIDGVDVSECKYYDDGTCCDKDVMSLSCENTDCIYKQLKRLEQENEQLLSALQEIRDMATLFHSVNENKDLDHFKNNILTKINEVIGAEE